MQASAHDTKTVKALQEEEMLVLELQSEVTLFCVYCHGRHTTVVAAPFRQPPSVYARSFLGIM